MFNRLREKFSRKWIVSVLLVCFAAAATVGGIKYYELKEKQRLYQNPAYRTAVGIIGLERYPKLALSQEQARKLLPAVRELAGAKNAAADGSKQADAMKKVLTPEQLDFVNTINQNPNPDDNFLAPKALNIKGLFMAAGVKGFYVEKGVNDRDLRNKRSRGDRGRYSSDGKGELRSFVRGGLYGRRGAGVYSFLLEILMQKIYG